MMKFFDQKGYTLLEALLAVAFAGLFFVGAYGLLLTSHRTSSESATRQKALWEAQRGIEALQTIEFNDLFLTEVGSLSFAGSKWTLAVAGPEDLGNSMERTVRVQEAHRDIDCLLVPAGGEVDIDSLFFESEVTWDDLRGNPQAITLRTLRTNWSNPDDTCYASDCSQLDWDVLTGTWYGGKQLRDIYITNNTGEDKEIDTITMTWDRDAEIQQIFFGNTKFWSSAGPGSPSGEQESGTVLDGENGVIADGQMIEMNKVQFEHTMTGSTITVEFECVDGSGITFGPFTPAY